MNDQENVYRDSPSGRELFTIGVKQNRLKQYIKDKSPSNSIQDQENQENVDPDDESAKQVSAPSTPAGPLMPPSKPVVLN